MSRLLKVCLGVYVTLGVTSSADQIGTSSISQMFENGRVSGEIRSTYLDYKPKKSTNKDTYATAVGGYLKYELSEMNGFSGTFTFTTSHDVGFATGKEGIRQNSELSSSNGAYTTLSEVYVNYNYDTFNIRAGRQLIDTPLADSDDIRMIANTFEAYIASYEISNFTFIIGNLQNWQGTDAGLDNGWVKAGENGTLFGSVAYANEILEASAWYYNITKLTNASYFDVSLKYDLNSNISILGALQYLHESEISNSGIEASIYGALAEVSVSDFGFSAAYNKSLRKSGKETFSGFGGGTLFTNMDTMILNDIAVDRKVDMWAAAISYEFNDLLVYYVYGDSDGGADSLGKKAHVIEQDFCIEYSIIRDKLVAYSVYAVQEDKENIAKTDSDWKRFQLMLAYSF
jgi:hypothetical protein